MWRGVTQSPMFLSPFIAEVGQAMHMRLRTLLPAAGVAALSTVALAQGDPDMVARIIEEGKNNNKVWSHLEYISYEIGPRLTGSSRLTEANEWARDQFEAWGLENSHLHEWGQINVRFDRGPSYGKMIEPAEHEFSITTPTWTPGTSGVVTGPVFKMPGSLEDLEQIQAELEGSWILTRGRQRGRRRGVVPAGMAPEVMEEISAALEEAGIAGRIVANNDELVRTFSNGRWNTISEMTLEEALDQETTMYVRRSDYDAMNSRIADGEDVQVEVNLDNQLIEGPHPIYNTIAEIPGTEWPEQVVIISAHLDSWDGPGSLGTQDNGTGASVTLEAARILMAVGAKPKRTIRFILWTGEEQGLLGARAYVNSLSETERANISACFVDDGGTNYQGGLVCIESMSDMLSAATAPVNEAFPDMPVEITTRNRMPSGGGSDHAAFNAVGIPGFFWTESGSGGREGKNYRYVWHTQHDTPRYAVPEYLVQSSTCTAVTAYNLACADTLLPRQQPREDTEAEAEEESSDESFAAVDGPATGTWNARLLIGDEPAGNSAFSIVLEQDTSGNLRGKTQSEMGEGEIKSGTYNSESGDLKFVVNHPDLGSIDFTAKIENNTMTGKLSMGDQFSADFKAEKKTD